MRLLVALSIHTNPLASPSLDHPLPLAPVLSPITAPAPRNTAADLPNCFPPLHTSKKSTAVFITSQLFWATASQVLYSRTCPHSHHKQSPGLHILRDKRRVVRVHAWLLISCLPRTETPVKHVYLLLANVCDFSLYFFECFDVVYWFDLCVAYRPRFSVHPSCDSRQNQVTLRICLSTDLWLKKSFFSGGFS